MSFTNINSLNEEERNDFLSSLDNVFSDCDGVLWIGNNKIPGASEVMNSFKERGMSVFYLTNNSTKTTKELEKKCLTLGFKADKSEVICTAWLTAFYLKSINFNKKVYVIGEKSIKEELDEVGIENLGVGPDHYTPSKTSIMTPAKAEFDPNIGAVVVGYDTQFSFPKIYKACTYLNKPDCIFLATNTDERFPNDNVVVIPGAGTFVRAIETAAGRSPIILGKPSTFAFNVVMKEKKLNPARTLMIGDRCNTDIQFGKAAGMKTMLVLTGINKLADIEEYKKQGLDCYIPDYYANSIQDLVKFFE